MHRRRRPAQNALQHALFQDLDLLLRVLERRLAERDELGPALVRRQRLLQRQLLAFHGRDDALELGEGGFEVLGRRGVAHSLGRASTPRR